MRNLILTLTDVGRIALRNAALNGLDVAFSHIALGDKPQAATSAHTALGRERERQAIFSVAPLDGGIARIRAEFGQDIDYTATEVGVIGDGVLFAVWSTPDTAQALVFRQSGVPFICTLHINMAALPSQNVTVLTQPLDAAMRMILEDGIAKHEAKANPHPQYQQTAAANAAQAVVLQSLCDTNRLMLQHHYLI